MSDDAKLAADSKRLSAQANVRVLSARLQTALGLHDSGVALKRAQLRRADPRASETLIAERLGIWLRTRPGALHGDAEGLPRPKQGETA